MLVVLVLSVLLHTAQCCSVLLTAGASSSAGAVLLLVLPVNCWCWCYCMVLMLLLIWGGYDNRMLLLLLVVTFSGCVASGTLSFMI